MIPLEDTYQSDTETSIVLSVSGLRKRFGGLVATNEVTFDVHENEILGIIGPNGAGKSTLFSLLAGLTELDSGELVYFEKNISRLPAYKRARLGIVKTFQNTRLFEDLSVIENVMTAAMYKYSVSDAREVGHNALGRVGASELALAKVSDLTMAQRVRIEIARALATEPKLLMLDEVFSPLDRDEIAELSELIASLRDDGFTLMMIEHHIPPLVRLVDRILALNFGSVIAIGQPQAVMQNEQVISAYLGTK